MPALFRNHFVWLSCVFALSCGPDGHFNDRPSQLLATQNESAASEVGDGNGTAASPDGNANDNIDAGKNSSDPVGDVLNNNSPPKPLNEADVAKRCSDIASTKLLAQPILAPQPTKTCDWGQDGNMHFDAVKHQKVITARREQNLNVNLPPNAIVCEMTFDFPVQEIRYDDEIILAFNNIVLFASQDYTQDKYFMPDAKDLVKYDWTNLKGKYYPHSARPTYFVDSTCKDFCKIPPTETTGQIKFRVDPSTIQKIAVETSAQTTAHTFKFVTTGDNDSPIDCIHSNFNFNVNIRYLPAP